MEEINRRIEVYQTTIKQREDQLRQLHKEEFQLESELAELISKDYKCRQKELELKSQCLHLQMNISQEEERKNKAEAEILQLSCIAMAKDEEGRDRETDSTTKHDDLMLELDKFTRLRFSWFSWSDAKRTELIKEIADISSKLAKCQRDCRRLVSEAMKSDKNLEAATRCGIISTDGSNGAQQRMEATHQMIVDAGKEADSVQSILEPLEKNLDVARAQLQKLDANERKLKSEFDLARQRSAGRPHLWS